VPRVGRVAQRANPGPVEVEPRELAAARRRGGPDDDARRCGEERAARCRDADVEREARRRPGQGAGVCVEALCGEGAVGHMDEGIADHRGVA
jgi:hypothetical protein